MDHSAQALPLAALMLDAQRVLYRPELRSSILRRRWAGGLDRAAFDLWRAQTLLQLTAAANDEPTPPAVA